MQHSIFKEAGTKNWKTIGNRAGYDVAEFTADISGNDPNCITVRRYISAMYTGYKRHVIGMGCAIAGTAPVYDLLAKIDAPGG